MIYEINYNTFVAGWGECNTSKYIQAKDKAHAIDRASELLGISRKEIIFCKTVEILN